MTAHTHTHTPQAPIMLDTIVVLLLSNWSKAVIDFYNLFTKTYWFSTLTHIRFGLILEL